MFDGYFFTFFIFSYVFYLLYFNLTSANSKNLLNETQYVLRKKHLSLNLPLSKLHWLELEHRIPFYVPNKKKACLRSFLSFRLHSVHSHDEKTAQITWKSLVVITCWNRLIARISLPDLTCSKLTMVIPEQCMRDLYNIDFRTTLLTLLWCLF